MNHYLIFVLFIALFGYSACNDRVFNWNNNESQINVDSFRKEWKKAIKEDSLRWVESGGASLIEKEELSKHPFFGYFTTKFITDIPIVCHSGFEYSASHNTDSILSYMRCVTRKTERIKLLRRALITAKFDQSRSVDSLKFLSDSQLMQMITLAYNQDIPSDALEYDTIEFEKLYQSISHMIDTDQSKAEILKFINDSVFSYYYMSVDIYVPTKNILTLDYNGGGMAGSAEKRYFLKKGKDYSELHLSTIISTVERLMSRVAKEDASADTDRFEGLFLWDEQKGMYQIQLFVHVSSGARCCPKYIVQLLTKDFKSIQSGSLKYATTEHISDSTVKPLWRNIR